MSLLWIEGFETDSQASSFSRKYTQGNAENQGTLGDGRFGGKSMRSSNGDAWTLSTNDTGREDSLVCGIAIKGSGFLQGVKLLDFRGDGDQQALTVRQNDEGNGKVSFSFLNKETELHVSPVMDPNLWIYIEAWMLFEVSSTQVNTIFRINGMVTYYERIDNGISPTRPGYDTFSLNGGSTAGGYTETDDFYLLNHTADGPADFLPGSPNIAVQTLYPLANGSNTEWDLEGAPSNVEAIDDSRSQALSDSDYVVGDGEVVLDLYRMDKPTYIAGEVFGVDFEIDTKVDDGDASSQFQFLLQSGLLSPVKLHDLEYIVVLAIAADFNRLRHLHATSPATGSPFDLEELRDFQLGFGNKDNFTPLIVEEEEEEEEEEEVLLDYGTAANPTGTALDFGSSSNPTGPDLDLGNA